jgi:hypothetical protein
MTSQNSTCRRRFNSDVKNVLPQKTLCPLRQIPYLAHTNQFRQPSAVEGTKSILYVIQCHNATTAAAETTTTVLCGAPQPVRSDSNTL